MAHNDYYVAIRDNDGWAVKRPKADRASGLFDRKWQAEKGRFVRCNCPQCRRA